MKRCDLFKHAYAMAYVSLLSLIPSIAVAISLISLFTPILGKDAAMIGQLKTYILDNLTPASSKNAIDYIDQTLANLNFQSISLSAFAGMLVTLVLLLRQIEMALNRIFLVTKNRNPFTRFIYFWSILTFGTFLVSLGIGLTSGFSIDQFLASTGSASIDRSLIHKWTPSVFMFIGFTTLYKIVPNCNVELSAAATGAFPATLLMTLTTTFYQEYVELTSYGAVYGALASIPILLFWLYIIWIIILFGAVISWRKSQGFSFEKDLDNMDENLALDTKLRNQQLQAMMPILVLLTIHENFNEGHKEGLSGQQITQKLNIPPTWVDEALYCLSQMGYLTSTPHHSSSDITMIAEQYPTAPASKIKLQKLYEDLHGDTRKWIDRWGPNNNRLDLQRIATKLFDGQTGARKELTLEDVMAQNRLEGTSTGT